MSVRFALAILSMCAACSGSSTSGSPSDAAVDGAVSNVEFAAATCSSPGACGGDPRGTWTIVSGCTQSPAGWCAGAVENGSGTVSGRYLIGDGGYTFQQDRELLACGRRRGTGESTSAPCTITGSRIVFASGGGVDFCVQGDTLWIIDTNATYPELAVVNLTRITGDAG